MNVQKALIVIYVTVACLFLTVDRLQAQVMLSESNKLSKNSFPLADRNLSVAIYYDADEQTAVKTSVHLFAEDIKRVTGNTVSVRTVNDKRTKNMVLVGTLGQNKLIEQLVKNKKITVDGLEGGWEQYTIQVVENPFPQVEKALVVVGSDRRGASYGLFSISEVIGVSPWYWWADVPVKKRDKLQLEVNTFTSS